MFSAGIVLDQLGPSSFALSDKGLTLERSLCYLLEVTISEWLSNYSFLCVRIFVFQVPTNAALIISFFGHLPLPDPFSLLKSCLSYYCIYISIAASTGVQLSTMDIWNSCALNTRIKVDLSISIDKRTTNIPRGFQVDRVSFLILY